MKKLKIVYLNMLQLVKLEGNPRKIINPDAKDKLKLLIEEHGFQNPLQVFKEKTKQYSILCGNHRFDVGIELGMTDFPCIVYEGSRAKALARAISDNRSNEWTEWDYPLLKEIFTEIDTGDFDVELTGFNEDELKGLFDYDVNTEGQLIEKSEGLKPYNKTHILLSFSPNKLIDIQPYLEKICNIEGIEYEQSSN